MSLSPTNKLRLLNLAYIQMQADFKRILPDLFRAGELELTTDASGYIYLPSNSFEVELIVKTSNKDPLEAMDKKIKFAGTGWYHDGVQTTGDDAGKRRIMVRKAGAAWASLGITIDYLIEYAELTDLEGTPYPFVQQRYRNMLTELQAFMLHMEGGKEGAKEAEKHWNVYQFFLKQAAKDMLDKSPRFMSSAHPDAGDAHSSPMLSS